MSAPIAISRAAVAHRALILDSFWREYSRSPAARGVSAHILGAKMAALLDSPDWTALAATPTDDADTVIGYLIFRDVRTVGWVHVVRDWRDRGVARALFAQAGISPGVVACPFLPPEVAKDASGRGWVLRFRPYLPDVELEAAAQRAAKALDVVG